MQFHPRAPGARSFGRAGAIPPPRPLLRPGTRALRAHPRTGRRQPEAAARRHGAGRGLRHRPEFRAAGAPPGQGRAHRRHRAMPRDDGQGPRAGAASATGTTSTWSARRRPTAPIAARADAALFHFTHDILREDAAIDNVLSHLKPGARVVATGLQWAPPWLWPANGFVMAAALYSVTSLDEPGPALGQAGARACATWSSTRRCWAASTSCPGATTPPKPGTDGRTRIARRRGWA